MTSQFKQYLQQAIAQIRPLEERSLGRFYTHFNNHEPIAFISADRSELSKSENAARYKQLKTLVKLSGFGFNRVKGGYVETTIDKDGKRVDVPVDGESSLIVYGGTADNQQKLFSLAIQLGRRFNQDAVMLIDTDHNVTFADTNSNHSTFGSSVKIGKFTANSIGQFYTKIGKSKFSFELLEQDDTPLNPISYYKMFCRKFQQYLDQDPDSCLEKFDKIYKV